MEVSTVFTTIKEQENLGKKTDERISENNEYCSVLQIVLLFYIALPLAPSKKNLLFFRC